MAEWKYLKKLQEAADIVKSCSKSVVTYITENQGRQYAAEVLNGQTITQNQILHTYIGLKKSFKKFSQ